MTLYLKSQAMRISFSFLSSANLSLRSPLRCAPARSFSQVHSKSTITSQLPSRAREYASMPEPPLFHPSQSPTSPAVFSFFERDTSTWQYVVADPVTMDAALIDAVLDYNPASGAVTTTTADGILSFIEQRGINIKYILETHAHADHLSAAQYYKNKLNAPVGIGKRISVVQDSFAAVYAFEPSAFDNAFDILFDDDEELKLGRLGCRIIHLPGHTPDHVGYVIGQSVFTGDSIFYDGSARSDFPGGDAKALYSSLQRLMALPESFRLFLGHDYPVGRQHLCVSTVGEQRKSNKHVGVTDSEFIKLRSSRDSLLGAPRLLHPSIQTNIRGGKLPPRDERGRRWFKTPITTRVHFT